MKILICGAGKGSWEMRGQQLGAAMGARVTSTPTDVDFAWCDVAVLVKKHAVSFAPRAHKAGKPIVWDALDFWSQPAQNHYTRDAARLTLRHQAAVIKPALVIGATEAMAIAAESIGLKSAYLPHHSWINLVPTAPRPQVQVVAYEGNPAYLGRWCQWLKEACALHGWAFVVNPPNLAEVDILVSFRDGAWDGWMCREWKSGVKLVNAIAAGRPFVSQLSAPAREIAHSGVRVESDDQLAAALDDCASRAFRERAYAHAIDHGFTVEAIAGRYLQILSTVETPCATT